MTRKQALSAAIETLNAAGQTEAAEILHKLSGELPFFSWSEDAIFDAVEQFILDHGRVPTTTDFKKRGLPPHTVIKRRFGVTLQEWLDQNYLIEKTPPRRAPRPGHPGLHPGVSSHPSRQRRGLQRPTNASVARLVRHRQVQPHPTLAHPAGEAEPPHTQQPRHAAQRTAVEGEGHIGL